MHSIAKNVSLSDLVTLVADATATMTSSVLPNKHELYLMIDSITNATLDAFQQKAIETPGDIAWTDEGLAAHVTSQFDFLVAVLHEHSLDRPLEAAALFAKMAQQIGAVVTMLKHRHAALHDVPVIAVDEPDYEISIS